MKLSLGSQERAPTIAMSVSQEEQLQLEDMAEYHEAYEQLVGNGDIKTEEVDGQWEYLFLLRRIGRSRLSAHERRLQSISQVINSTSRLTSGQPSITGLIIGTKQIDEQLQLGAFLQWPEGVPDTATSHFAGNVMRSIALQLSYKPSLASNKSKYARYVGAHVNRANHDKSHLGVFLRVAGASSAGVRTIEQEYKPQESTFRLKERNIYSFKQQLICLSGILAVAQLAEVANSQQIS